MTGFNFFPYVLTFENENYKYGVWDKDIPAIEGIHRKGVVNMTARENA